VKPDRRVDVYGGVRISVPRTRGTPRWVFEARSDKSQYVNQAIAGYPTPFGDDFKLSNQGTLLCNCRAAYATEWWRAPLDREGSGKHLIDIHAALLCALGLGDAAADIVGLDALREAFEQCIGWRLFGGKEREV
jgi:hypothetical protein